jgi:hypothetical protein
LVKDSGYVVLVCAQGAYSWLDKKGFDTPYFSFLPTINWEFRVCAFISRKHITNRIVIVDPIISKIFGNKNERFDMGFEPDSKKLLLNSETVQLDSKSGYEKVQMNLPKGSELPQYWYVKEGLSAPTPKFIFPQLETVSRYLVTNEKIYVPCSIWVNCNTLEEAKKLLLFVKNNKVLRYFSKSLKQKSHSGSIRRVKRFDLSQIQTGFEIPKEWNLTHNEIILIEKYFCKDNE